MLVGEPVEVADLLAAAAQQGWGEAALQVAIADRVGQVRRCGRGGCCGRHVLGPACAKRCQACLASTRSRLLTLPPSAAS